MNKLIVPFEIAQRLKALGFNEPCLISYWGEEHTTITCDARFPISYNKFSPVGTDAPFWCQVEDWFRTAHKLHVGYDLDNVSNCWIYFITNLEKPDGEINWSKDYQDFETAREQGNLKLMDFVYARRSGTDNL